ncbi:hypothetical protein [Mucilaginibacter sp. NFR10]|uniref:hypothetical protein n=1 Tax=Mucilaginibacter sp. NFR10 TaxID=1566292 RepID=UPI0008714D18|nr:hypothetical protein [Mucilaginibacter sp. NFR10]SCW37944.1 hypothetical protein SAMN03159284_00089 [Mucilaginibacter sp. NFR10]
MQKRRVKRRIIEKQKSVEVFDDILAENTNQGMGHQIPPLVGYVIIYFCQQNMAVGDAQSFFQHYENLDWKTVTGRPQKNWKVLAKDWIYNAVQQTKFLERQEAKRVAFPGT